MMFGLAFPPAWKPLLLWYLHCFLQPSTSLLSDVTFSRMISPITEFKLEATSTFCLACSLPLPLFYFYSLITIWQTQAAKEKYILLLYC